MKNGTKDSRKRRLAASCAAACGAATLFAASPTISNVTVSQPRTTYKVEIAYTLSAAPAVVTVDFQTNRADGAWTSIGAENFTAVAGDVNRRVEPGARKITWKPRAEWPCGRLAAGTMRAVLTAHDVTQPPPWMAADLANGTVRYYVSTNALPGGFGDARYKSSTILLRRIPGAGAQFRMGGTGDVKHDVAFTRDWYCAIYETTYGQYRRFAGGNADPAVLEGDDKPAGSMTFASLRGTGDWPKDGHAVTGGTLASLRTMTGVEFDLPTEAQWEFSCRAGSSSDVSSGWPMTNDVRCVYMEDVAWCRGNSGEQTHAVGLKPANAFGLYDMHGNVSELTLDWYAPYSAGLAVDPTGPVEGVDIPNGSSTYRGRVHRGGQYQYYEINCAAGKRNTYGPLWGSPGTGFRLVAPATAVAGKGDVK